MVKKPILGISLAGLMVVSGSLSAISGKSGQTGRDVELAMPLVSYDSSQPEADAAIGELSQAFHGLDANGTVDRNQRMEVIARIPKPLLTRIQDSKHWKRFVAICENNGTRTTVEFVVATGLAVAAGLILPETVVVGFGLHLLGRFFNKHFSPIPYLARYALVTVGGFVFFRWLAVVFIR